MRKIFNFLIKFSLYALVFLMPLFWLPWSNEVYEFNKQYLLVFLTAIALMAWLAKMILVQKKFVFKRTPLDIFILAFMAIMILAAVFSVDKAASWLGLYGRFTDSVVGFLALGVMYFVVVNNIKAKSTGTVPSDLNEGKKIGLIPSDSGILPLARSSGENAVEGRIPSKSKKWGLPLGKIIWVLVVSSSLLVITTYFSIFGLWNKLPGLIRPMGIQSFNPASGSLEGLSIFLVMVIGTAAGLLFSLKWLNYSKSTKVKKSKLKVQSYFLFPLLIASVILLIIIDFKPAWIALGVTMLMLLVIAFWTRLFRKRVNLLLWPIVLLIVTAICWTSNFDQALVRDVLGINPPPKEIILDYQTASSVTWQVVKEWPVLGSGPGTFLANFTKFKPVEFNQTRFWNIRFDKGPSQLLEMVGTTGTLGILSYLVIWGIFLLIMFMSLRKIGKGSETVPLPLLLPWLALLIGQFVYLGNTVIIFYFWLFMALGMVIWRGAQAIPAKQIVFSFKKLPEVGLIMNVVLLILVFALIALFYLGGRFYLADAKFIQPTADNQELIQELEEVVNLDKYRENYRRALSQAYLVGAWAEARRPAEEQRVQLLQAYASGAIGQARLAASLSPNLVYPWESLGIIYRDSRGLVGGTLPFALEAFAKAAELEPTNPFFYRELCRINLISEDKDLDETLAYCQRAIDLKENYLDAHIQLALVYEKRGELEGAAKQMERTLDRLKGVSFQRGSALAGAATEIYFQLGRLYFNLNRIDESIKMFEQAVIITPQYANPRYGLAVSYQIKGRLEDALIQFQIINQIVGGNPDVEARIRQLQALLAPVIPAE